MENDKTQPEIWLGLCILDRIKVRDPEGARQTMRDHLTQAQDLFEMAREESETTPSTVNTRLKSAKE